MQAVLRPASARPKAARRPAPPAPLEKRKGRESVQREGEEGADEEKGNAHNDRVVLVLDQRVLARDGGLQEGMESVSRALSEAGRVLLLLEVETALGIEVSFLTPPDLGKHRLAFSLLLSRHCHPPAQAGGLRSSGIPSAASQIGFNEFERTGTSLALTGEVATTLLATAEVEKDARVAVEPA